MCLGDVCTQDTLWCPEKVAGAQERADVAADHPQMAQHDENGAAGGPTHVPWQPQHILCWACLCPSPNQPWLQPFHTGTWVQTARDSPVQAVRKGSHQEPSLLCSVCAWLCVAQPMSECRGLQGVVGIPSRVSEEGSFTSTHCGPWGNHSLSPGLSLSICEMEMLRWPCRIPIGHGCSNPGHVLATGRACGPQSYGMCDSHVA